MTSHAIISNNIAYLSLHATGLAISGEFQDVISSVYNYRSRRFLTFYCLTSTLVDLIYT